MDMAQTEKLGGGFAPVYPPVPTPMKVLQHS